MFLGRIPELHFRPECVSARMCATLAETRACVRLTGETHTRFCLARVERTHVGTAPVCGLHVVMSVQPGQTRQKHRTAAPSVTPRAPGHLPAWLAHLRFRASVTSPHHPPSHPHLLATRVSSDPSR